MGKTTIGYSLIKSSEMLMKQRLVDKSLIKSSGAWILPSAGGSPAVRGSLPVAHRSFDGAASFFMMILSLVSHQILK
ncbi:hypothetical protein HAX54_027845, partial [Datura stramonium]|nr:hypothetical protein [Datura stramonium]